ncbi:hypothetical protein ACFW04_011167 [Cataglyphis niger]
MSTDFYIRYYVGHKGKFGHEFLEFEFRPDGKLRYANNSTNYKNDTMIRKEAYVHQCVMEELKRIIQDSEIMQEERLAVAAAGPRRPARVGNCNRDEHISFTTSRPAPSWMSISHVTQRIALLYYLVQDLKCLVFSLIGLHFKIKPI